MPDQELAAYACLLRRARGGLPLAGNDTIQDRPLGPIIGHGMLGDESIVVHDRLDDALMVPAEVEKRVIATTGGGLRVVITLTWETTDDANHTSTAVWEAKPDVAARMAGEPMASEAGVIRRPLVAVDAPGALLAAAPGYDAMWAQTMPGCQDGEFDESMDGKLAASLALYHVQTLADVVRSHPWMRLLTAYSQPFSMAHLVPLHDYSKYLLSSVPAC